MTKHKYTMLNEVISELKPKVKVVIRFTNGMYYKGKVKNIAKELHSKENLKVTDIKETYSTFSFRKHLVKEIHIYVNHQEEL